VQLTSRPQWVSREQETASPRHNFCWWVWGAHRAKGMQGSMGGQGPAKPHRSQLSGLHVEGAQYSATAATSLRTLRLGWMMYAELHMPHGAYSCHFQWLPAPWLATGENVKPASACGPAPRRHA
jgi:hypothetical protein